jgi:hypothetical protein
MRQAEAESVGLELAPYWISPGCDGPMLPTGVYKSELQNVDDDDNIEMRKKVQNGRRGLWQSADTSCTLCSIPMQWFSDWGRIQ